MQVTFDPLPDNALFAGVDTHSQSHWLCVLNARGEMLASREFPATPTGYEAIYEALMRLGVPVGIGIEGTATYGAGLARTLLEKKLPVWEVLKPERRVRARGSHKSDEADAERAARQVMSGRGLSVPKAQNGWVEELRALYVARERLVALSTDVANTALGLLRGAPDELSAPLRGLPARRAMPALLEAARPDGAVARTMLEALQALARTWGDATARAARLLERMGALIQEGCPAILAIYGCGTVSAAKLLIAAGDNPGRLRSEAAFAALCGASPIEASSGKVRRHRLNRGGNRRANSALHRIARRRFDCDQRTQAYVEKRRSQGLSDREIIRCLKRYIAREVFHALMNPYELKEDPRPHARRRAAQETPLYPLRQARRDAHITQDQASRILRISTATISRIERGLPTREKARETYLAWSAQGFPLQSLN